MTRTPMSYEAQVVSSAARISGPRWARHALRILRVNSERERTGQNRTADATITAYINQHGAPAEWTRGQWLELGNAFGNAGLRWCWSNVVSFVIVHEMDRGITSAAPIYASMKTAGVNPRGACWKGA